LFAFVLCGWGNAKCFWVSVFCFLFSGLIFQSVTILSGLKNLAAFEFMLCLSHLLFLACENCSNGNFLHLKVKNNSLQK
jgi:hypothetical protein